VRHLVLAALLAITAVNYIQRNSISPAETTIRKQLDLNIQQSGWAVSSFFFSYALLQVPSGWLAQRWGPRRALAVYAAGWSLAMGLCALATGLAGLLAARLALGALQAGIFPCATLVMAAWYPPSQRGLASALLNSFMLIGAAAGSILTGVLLDPLGWRWLFALYAVPGLLWSAWFLRWFRNRPQEHPGVNNAELAVIADAPRPTAPAPPTPAPASGKSEQVLAHHDALAQRPRPDLPAPVVRGVGKRGPDGEPERAPIPWGAVFLSTSLVLLYTQQFCRAGASRFLDMWLATYLQEGRGVTDLALVGTLASLPQWTGMVGGVVGGMLSDAILRRTRSRPAARKGVALAGLVGAVLCYLIAYPITNILAASTMLSLGAFLYTFSAPCSYALTMDMGGRHVAIVFGVMNMAGNLGSFAVTWVLPQLKAWTGNWEAGLALFVGMQVAAVVCWVFLDPRGEVGERAGAAER
jgi:ACS family glucarate transporter-like MFS transporter